MEGLSYNFLADVKRFNSIYGLPVNDKLTLPTIQRLKDFKSIIIEEVQEVDDVIKIFKTNASDVQKMTELSDWLGDLIVYVASESVKIGKDINKVLEIIMRSNFSKLDKDGKPIYDERGKVMRGENYFKPEPQISKYLETIK
jgi:predicted HAD superfamily Cof-like phosphohydrolase